MLSLIGAKESSKSVPNDAVSLSRGPTLLGSHTRIFLPKSAHTNTLTPVISRMRAANSTKQVW